MIYILGYPDPRKTGEEKRRHRGSVRIGCKYWISFRKDADGVYRSLNRELIHTNHDPQQECLIPRHIDWDFEVLELIESMVKQNLKTNTIIEVIEGHYRDKPVKTKWGRKDLSSLIYRIRNHPDKALDAIELINELQNKSLTDPDFVYRLSVDDDKRLRHIFLSFSSQRVLLAKYGDVLLMDATYKTNRYRMPLIFVSGIDGNGRTVPFAAAFVSNETAETYEWFLRELMNLYPPNMGPSRIFTDDDASIGMYLNFRHNLTNST